MKHQGPYVMGIDAGTERVRVAIFTLNGSLVAFAGVGYDTTYPYPGWAEQDPNQWWTSLCQATRKVLAENDIRPAEIIGIGLDCTSCSVVITDDNGNPLRPAIIWMDNRAAEEARLISATGDPALRYNGYGNVSAEWMPCKALWLKRNEPDNYHRATRVAEFIDWYTFKMTGRWTASINNTSARWYYHRPSGGWPVNFYTRIGLEDLIKKFPPEVMDLGALVGGLTAKAAADLGLDAGTPVAQGGADAFVAMIGLNVVEPGRLAFITGSSHLHLGLSKEEINAPGLFGAFPDAVIKGLAMFEGGQVSTGSILKWFRSEFCRDLEPIAAQQKITVYDVLAAEAAKISPGSEGLIVLDYWQGNRTPLVDYEVRGMIYGLSLRHTRAHVFRAIMEGVAYGTEHILHTFRRAGLPVNEVYACGGAMNSRLWAQIHADVAGVSINIPRISEAASLGSAILGAVAAGAFTSITDGAKSMVSIESRIEPNSENHEAYQFYAQKYREVYPALGGWMHAITRHEAGRKTK